MGDLSLLAVSLLQHSSFEKQQALSHQAIATVRAVSASPATEINTAAIGSKAKTEAVSKTEVHQPEFSSNTIDPQSSLAQQRSPQANAPFRVAPIAPVALPSPNLPSPDLPLPWLEPALPTPPLSDGLGNELGDYPAGGTALHRPSLETLRPRSGSQLYRQRVVALRAGRTYTRLPAHSFWQSWSQATQQPTYEQWVNLLAQEAGAMSRGQGSNRLTVLLGDSLYLWYPPEQLGGDRFWLNQGISGDTTTGVLRRLSAIAHTRPDTIHVMVGINDLRQGATDAEVINNSRQIMHQLRRNHPHAQIFVHSILPTRLAAIPSSRIHRINATLSNIARQEQVSYLELLNYFADAQGNLRRDLTTDGLHLNPRGYATWQWAMANG